MWGECESACCHGNKAAAPQSPVPIKKDGWLRGSSSMVVLHDTLKEPIERQGIRQLMKGKRANKSTGQVPLVSPLNLGDLGAYTV